jgi:hypothetical protein
MKFIFLRDDYYSDGGPSNAPISGVDITLMLIDGTSLSAPRLDLGNETPAIGIMHGAIGDTHDASGDLRGKTS